MVGAAMVVVASLAGCGGAASTVSAVPTTAGSPSTGSSASVPDATASAASGGAPTIAQWCASYASITTVLAQSSTDAAAATTALAALERFDLLWGIADNLGVVAPDEVAANQRAVASYRAVMALVASGKDRTSPEVVSATAALTRQTDADRTPLRDSAARVLGLCGVPSPTPSA